MAQERIMSGKLAVESADAHRPSAGDVALAGASSANRP
jgi:hypothetical protein